ncbi:MAG: hypothetical protein CVV56_06955 [Tenericutes bacterium HGW-Tenericutes-1]|jgi:putative MATE family efflux protein|nr:MAG: hypothetical protein CVV56_06955 [Tenericutes bacterium HGW-Tenericutes-1]
MNLRSLVGDKKFYKSLFTVALPIVAQQLITSSVQLVDNVMVGSLEESAIVSVSTVNQLYFVMMLITFGAIGGAGIYSAQYFGSKDFDKLKQTFRFKIMTALTVFFVSFIIFTVFGRTLIGFFTTNPVTIENAMDYLKIIRFGILPWVLTIAIVNTFRDMGITKPLMFISIAAIITNTVLNALLIFGLFGFPKLGIIGAAYATVIARTLEFVLSLVLLKRKGIAFDTKLKDVLKIDKKVLTSIFAMALPLMLNEALWSSGQTMFMQAYSMRGEYAFAAQNITGAISQLVFVTFGGVATGIAVLVGNTLGRNELEEAKENARKLIAFAVFFAACMGVLLFILSFFVLDIYKVAEETKRIAQFNIRVNALFIPVYSFNVALYFTLRSGGDTKSTLLMDSVYMWVVAVPIAFVMSRFTNWPVTIMFLLVQVTDIPKGLFGLSRYRKGYWIKNLAKNEEKVIVKT